MNFCFKATIALLLIMPFYFFGKGIKYPVSDIPEELKENADAVIREYSVVKTFHSISNIETTEHYVVTIFNESAKSLGYFNEQFDRDTKLSDYSIKTYNSIGLSNSNYKTKDFKYVAAYGDYTLFSDNKILYLNAVNNSYPYTVEISFTRTDKSSLFLGNWIPVPKPRVSVQNASLIVKTEPDFRFRYKVVNLSDSVKYTEYKSEKIYKWSLNNFKAIKKEPYRPDYRTYYPLVFLAPNMFEYDGYAGDLSSWESYGRWNWNLVKDRDIKDTIIQKQIKHLISDCKTDQEKIKTLYEYLQNNTRYVNVSLGIGGFQPFTAETVHENKYGDCKALSNYMRSMLKVVNINSHYAKIRSGGSDIDTNFPSQQSNHIILCVPNKGDTIWLECTNQKIPFGFIGEDNQNKTVLLVTEEGGKLAKTPTYHKNMNTSNGITSAIIDSVGNIQLNYWLETKAILYDKMNYLFYYSKEKQKEKLYKNFDIPRLKINNFKLSEKRNRIPEINLEVEAKIDKYAKISGNRLLVNPNILNQFSNVPNKVRERQYYVYSTLEYIDIDTVKLMLPEGYLIEYLPDSTYIETPFGIYKSSYIVKENELRYIRYHENNKGTFPPNEYSNFRKFYKDIAKADNQKLVLIKDTN